MPSIPSPITIDLETEGIKPRPQYPPPPVGVSIKYKSKRPKYYAFGHPDNNNCTFSDAKKVVREAYRSGEDLLFQNAKFDVDVIEEFFGLPVPNWERVHDTLYLIALYNPFAPNFSLKPSAERILNRPPEEQDVLKSWILSHVFTTEKSGGGEAKIYHPAPKKAPVGMHKVPASKAGAFICYTPGDLCGTYANADTSMTWDLFRFLYKRVVIDEGMGQAYDRERRLMPVLLNNEREGVFVNLPELRKDIKKFKKEKERVDTYLRKKLKCSDLNIDSDQELAEVLDTRKIVTEWEYTPKSGQRKTSKETMTIERFSDKKIFYALAYRNRMQTCLSMFMEPWERVSSCNDGRIFTSWNQVRQTRGGNSAGARTGRISSTPNLMNLSTEFEGRGDGYKHPGFLRGLPKLPNVRRYVLPDPGCEWIHRDYSQQELRILAHFADGVLMEQFLKNPRTDAHEEVQALILNLLGIDYPRKFIKTINFGTIYGMGLASTAQKLQESVDVVRQIKKAHAKALPDVDALSRELKHMGPDEAIVTWGGRVYYLEPPKMVEGKMRTFEYKRLNYLIQGSAGDCTKEAIINYDSAKKYGRFLVTVHDENNICAPRKLWRKEDEILRREMESIDFDVPMLTDMKHGKNWGDIK